MQDLGLKTTRNAADQTAYQAVWIPRYRGGFRAVSGPAKRQLRVVRRGHSTVQVLGSSKAPDFRPGDVYPWTE